MTVTSLSGATVKLVTGFDPRLREFFLSLRDVRVAAPDEEQDEEQPDHTLLHYDSLCEAQPMRSISYVEGRLEEHEIPFGDEDQNPAGQNPRLLPLLIAILNEQQTGGAEVGRTLRNWDVEAVALAPEPH